MPIMPAYMFNISGKFQCKTDPSALDKILGLQFPKEMEEQMPKMKMNARTFIERYGNIMI
jgi:hypothetical protein